MKKILMAAVALTALTATPAMAADDGKFTVIGTVGASCGAISGSTLDFGSLVGTEGTIKAGSVTPASQTGYCTGGNSTATVTKVDLAAKTKTGTPPSGFVNSVSFTPSVTIGGTTVPADGAAHSVGAFSGNVVVGASISASSARPVADDYEGSITVTLGAAA